MTHGNSEDQRPTRREPTRRASTRPLPPRMDTDRAAGTGASAKADPVRSKILYGGLVGLAAALLVAFGLSALFDISFFAALGITALIGLGLVMLLAVLVG